MDLLLLKNCDVYSPSHKGLCDIAIAGGVIVGTREKSKEQAGNDAYKEDAKYFKDIIDMEGCVAIPGFVDMHVHVTGGGGEKGPASRVPEAKISELVSSGVTTVVGVLGTDGVSRSLENLLTKVLALNEEGITAYMYTGNYRVPVVTLTGSVQRDIMLIEKIIGVGEIAISDHRGTNPSFQDLSLLASDARTGGMLSGKAGIVHAHMGDGKSGLDPLWEIVRNTPIPITQFVPTHMSRNEKLAESGKEWLKAGGYADFTADGHNVADHVSDYLRLEGGASRVTVSSDAYGSLPRFDEHGVLVGYDYGKPDSLLRVLKDLVVDKKIALPEALAPFTSNPANILKLQGKGKIEKGRDADIIILDKDINIKYVIAKGVVVKSPSFTKTGMFEQ